MTEMPLEDLVTLICVTSPVRSNPSTEMLEWTMRSFARGGGLGRCRSLIASDGYKVAQAGQKEKPKSGRVAPESIAPYEEFRSRLDALIGEPSSGDDWTANARHLRMASHCNFSGCVKACLDAVATPFVLVLQHDRNCLRPFDARGILRAMELSRGIVKYVGLPTKASLARASVKYNQSRWGLTFDLDEVVSQVASCAAQAQIHLRYLLYWYDSAHFCETTYYRTFVFNSGRIPRGGFPEDTLGQTMQSEIFAAGPQWRDAHEKYGTYLYVDDAGEAVGHLGGRQYLDSAVVEQRGWRGNRAKWMQCGTNGAGEPGGRTQPPVRPDVELAPGVMAPGVMAASSRREPRVVEVPEEAQPPPVRARAGCEPQAVGAGEEAQAPPVRSEVELAPDVTAA